MVKGVQLEKLEKMMQGIKEPDVVIYLRTEESVSSRQGFGAERYETTEIQTRVQKNFDDIFSRQTNYKILKINSNQEIEEISKEIWDHIKKLL